MTFQCKACSFTNTAIAILEGFLQKWFRKREGQFAQDENGHFPYFPRLVSQNEQHLLYRNLLFWSLFCQGA